jgi:hypothetical protein
MAIDSRIFVKGGMQNNAAGVEGGAAGGRDGSVLVSHGLPDYYELCRNGYIQQAHAIVTAPVIYTTNTGTGGPMLHNRTANKVAVLLKVGVGVSTVSTVGAALGLTGRSDQGDTVMTATSAIDSQSNMYLGGSASAMSLYKIATPAVAGNWFLPLGDLHTGALTTDNFGMGWFDMEGLIIVPPGAWVSLAASATASTTVMSAAFIWAELFV